MDNNLNNSKKLWFKARRYGWGWAPVSWEGWVILAAYLAIILSSALKIDAQSHSVSDTLINLAIIFIPATLVLIYICYKKGERPYWNWGKQSTLPVSNTIEDKEQK